MNTPSVLILCWLVATALCSAPAHAQTARVRSGEHEGFSRLAVDMPNRQDWAIGGKGRHRELTFAGNGVAFDVSEVFTRISGARIASVRPLRDTSGLQIVLNCACRVDAFWHGRSMLVIDVADPADDSEAGSVVTPAADGLGQPSPGLPQLLRSAAQNPTTGIASKMASNAMSAKSKPVLPSDALATSNAIILARHSIAQKMARAATAGLIDANVSIPIPPANADRAGAEVPRESAVAKPAPETDADAYIQIDPRTSETLEILPQLHTREHTADGRACQKNAFVAVGDWGSDAGFISQIGSARRDLFAEFDRYRPGAALRLARLYVFFGFGAEARQIINMAQLESAETDVLKAMALVIDDPEASPRFLANQTSCDADIAFWSTLSDETQEELPNMDAILRTLVSLPSDLRPALGARLAGKLAAAKHGDAAARILRILNRSGGEAAPAHALARAQVDLLAGRDAQATRKLKTVVASNSDQSSDALSKQVEALLTDRSAVAPELVDLVGAYALENRDTEKAKTLRNMHVAASAAAGRLDFAFGRLAEGRATSDDSAADITVFYAARDASDLTFLRYLLKPAKHLPKQLSPLTGNMVARRLIDLGFPESAPLYLAGDAKEDVLVVRRLLRAEANLALEAPRSALVDLLGMDSNDANILRAIAHSKLGQHQAAHLLYLAEGKTREALREAVLADEWAEASDVAEPLVSEIIEPDGGKVGDDVVGVLARNQSLLDQSRAARENITNFLSSSENNANPLGG